VGALDGEIWVCAECRSINNARAKQCYNCRTPRDLAAVDPASIEGTGHGKLRDVALPSFESPRPYAIVASFLILVVALMQIVSTVNVSRLITQVLDGTPATEEQFQFIGMVEIATLGIGLLALVAWSFWLSRAVVAMPALGLGYPAANGLMAFVENFLPGLNLLRVPAIVRDVVRRIEPGQNRGEALIFAAWIGLLLGFVVPRLGAFVTGFTAESEAAALRSTLTIALISTGFVLVGAIFLVALIWWIEQRIARRREAQLAEIDATTAGASGEVAETTEEGVSVPYAAPSPQAPAAPSAQAPAAPNAQAPAAPSGQAPAAQSPWSWRDTSDSPLAASTQQAMARGYATPGPGWDNEFAIAGAAEAPAAPAAPAPEPAPVAEPASAPQPEPIETGEPASPPSPEPEETLEPVRAVGPTETGAPAEAGARFEAVTPTTSAEPEAKAEPEAVRAEQPPSASQDEPGLAAFTNGGAPHLTIRVTNRGMLQAEMGGEIEPVILEDLTAYGQALANAGGTAEIVLAGNDGMVQLIARRAQRILADTGIDAPIPD
jgi:Na+-transporting methylmalonyl-CoA/oxaloacetate decarboxylase gamma subunit